MNVDSALELLAGSVSRSNVATTSRAVIGLPSWNLTPWRILNVHAEPSSLGSQLVASRGWGSSLRSDHTRYSPVCPSTARPPWLLTVTGSSAPAGAPMPALTVPPGLTLALAVWLLLSVLSLVVPEPHAAARKLSADSDMPVTAPRRMNSRRLDVPGAVLVDEVVLHRAAAPPDSVDPPLGLILQRRAPPPPRRIRLIDRNSIPRVKVWTFAGVVVDGVAESAASVAR